MVIGGFMEGGVVKIRLIVGYLGIFWNFIVIIKWLVNLF